LRLGRAAPNRQRLDDALECDEAAPHTTLRPPYPSLNYIYSEYILIDTV